MLRVEAVSLSLLLHKSVIYPSLRSSLPRTVFDRRRFILYPEPSPRTRGDVIRLQLGPKVYGFSVFLPGRGSVVGGGKGSNLDGPPLLLC